MDLDATPTLQYSFLCRELKRHPEAPAVISVTDIVFDFGQVAGKRLGIALVNCWTGSTGTFFERSELTDEDGHIVASTSAHKFTLGDVMSRYVRADRLIFDVPRTGTYWVVVFLGDSPVTRYPVRIRLPEDSKEQPGSTG